MNRHYCYILYNTDNKTTYNGYTVNLVRRLRQHNGELKGGAKATHRSSTWRFLCVVSCDAFTKHTALSFEWHVRYPTCKRPRPREFSCPSGRLRSLPLVFGHDKFKDMRFSVWIDEAYRDRCGGIVEFGENVGTIPSWEAFVAGGGCDASVAVPGSSSDFVEQ